VGPPETAALGLSPARGWQDARGPARVLLAKPHHDVLVVARRRLLVGCMPAATLLRVPRPLALARPARHLASANSWIRDELGATLAAAAGGCLIHPGMVPGQHLLPLRSFPRSARPRRDRWRRCDDRSPTSAASTPHALAQRALASAASTTPDTAPPPSARSHCRDVGHSWLAAPGQFSRASKDALLRLEQDGMIRRFSDGWTLSQRHQSQADSESDRQLSLLGS